MRLLFTLLVIAAGLSLAPDARAQSTPADTAAAPDPSEVNARRLFEAGRAAYEERRYADALAYFEQAYALTPRPRLLYNVGVAAEHTGDRARAITALEQYLAEAPDAENRAEVEGRLEILRRAAAEAEAEAAAQPAPDPAPPPPRSGAGPEGWIVLGASLAVAAAGGVMIGIGAGDYAAVEGLPDGGSWASVRDAYDRAPALSAAGIACAAVGLTGAVIGIVIATSAGGGGGGEVRAAIGPGGVTVRGTF